jgi:hypothetical protein
MADIKDLQKFAEDIVPVLKDLFPRASAGSAAPPADPALEATRKLQKLVAEAPAGTAATNLEAAAAVTAVRRALLAVLMGAATSNVTLSSTDANIIEVQFNALENRAGQLLAQAAFASIPTLIPPGEITQIETNLRQAAEEIQKRQQAKQVLDGVVQTVITAARIAAKVAA